MSFQPPIPSHLSLSFLPFSRSIFVCVLIFFYLSSSLSHATLKFPIDDYFPKIFQKIILNSFVCITKERKTPIDISCRSFQMWASWEINWITSQSSSRRVVYYEEWTWMLYIDWDDDSVLNGGDDDLKCYDRCFWHFLRVFFLGKLIHWFLFLVFRIFFGISLDFFLLAISSITILVLL